MSTKETMTLDAVKRELTDMDNAGVISHAAYEFLVAHLASHPAEQPRGEVSQEGRREAYVSARMKPILEIAKPKPEQAVAEVIADRGSKYVALIDNSLPHGTKLYTTTRQAVATPAEVMEMSTVLRELRAIIASSNELAGSREDCDVARFIREHGDLLIAALASPSAGAVVPDIDAMVTLLKHVVEFNEGICTTNEAASKALGFIGLYGRRLLGTGKAVLDGWKLVPVEPTDAMKLAALKEVNPLGELIDWDASKGECATHEDVTEVYKAMLAAAPEVDRG